MWYWYDLDKKDIFISVVIAIVIAICLIFGVEKVYDNTRYSFNKKEEAIQVKYGVSYNEFYKTKESDILYVKENMIVKKVDIENIRLDRNIIIIKLYGIEQFAELYDSNDSAKQRFEYLKEVL